MSLHAPAKLASTLCWKGFHGNQGAAVERAHSQGARSGSAGPPWVPFPSSFIAESPRATTSHSDIA